LKTGTSAGGGTPNSDCGKLAGAWYKEDGGTARGML